MSTSAARVLDLNVKRMHKQMLEFPFLWQVMNRWEPDTLVEVLKHDPRDEAAIRHTIERIKEMREYRKSWWYLHNVSATEGERMDEVARTEHGFTSNIRSATRGQGWGVAHIVVCWNDNAPFGTIESTGPTVIRPRKGMFLNDLIFSDLFPRRV